MPKADQGKKAETFKLRFVGADEDVPRLLSAGGKGCGGYLLFLMAPRTGQGIVALDKGKAGGLVWRGTKGEGPQSPTQAGDLQEVLKEGKALKASVGKPGPAVLKGVWKGVVHCVDGVLHAHLERKITSYGTLKIESNQKGTWAVRYERSATWFGEAEAKESLGHGDLAKAIEAGLGLVVVQTRAVCVVQATTRRGAVDPEFAQKQADRRAAKATDKPAKPPRAPKPDAWAKWEDIPRPKTPGCPESVQNITEATQMEAQALVKLGASVWSNSDAPDLLRRAGRLLRSAEALIASPLCKGPNKQKAQQALDQGIAAFKDASQKVKGAENSGPDFKRHLKEAAERAGLAAAWAGKSCSQGKPSTPTKPKKAAVVVPVIPADPPAKATRAPNQPSAKPTKAPRASDAQKDQAIAQGVVAGLQGLKSQLSL